MPKRFSVVRHSELIKAAKMYPGIKATTGLVYLQEICVELLRLADTDDQVPDWLNKAAPKLSTGANGRVSECDLLTFAVDLRQAERVEVLLALDGPDLERIGFLLEAKCFSKNQRRRTAVVPTLRFSLTDAGRFRGLVIAYS
jgi:hypothetical protein